MPSRPLLRCSAALLMAAATGAAQAGGGFIDGHFARDDQSVPLAFDLAGPQTVTFFSTSYAQGGFAPVLSLFDAGGQLLQVERGSSHACGGTGQPDPVSGFCWDVFLSVALDSGNYDLVLTQDGNDPLGPSLADGFRQTGRPDYTGQDWLGQSDHPFVQVDGSQRSSYWNLNFDVPLRHGLPEPAGLGLFALGLLAALSRSRPTAPASQPHAHEVHA